MLFITWIKGLLFSYSAWLQPCGLRDAQAIRANPTLMLQCGEEASGSRQGCTSAIGYIKTPLISSSPARILCVLQACSVGDYKNPFLLKTNAFSFCRSVVNGR